MFNLCFSSSTDNARLFIERVVGYATCDDVAPVEFKSEIINRLKNESKKKKIKGELSLHHELCVRHLFALGIGENDSDMVIERCEELLKKFKEQNGDDTNGLITKTDVILSMERLLQVTKKLLDESKDS